VSLWAVTLFSDSADTAKGYRQNSQPPIAARNPTGTTATMMSGTTQVFVNSADTLLLADFNNNRVLKFAADSWLANGTAALVFSAKLEPDKNTIEIVMVDSFGKVSPVKRGKVKRI